MGVRELALITIPVMLASFMSFLAWVALIVQRNNTFLKVLEARTDAKLEDLTKAIEIATKSIWEAEKQLRALWPLVPGANDRFSDRQKTTRNQ